LSNDGEVNVGTQKEKKKGGGAEDTVTRKRQGSTFGLTGRNLVVLWERSLVGGRALKTTPTGEVTK